MISKEILSEVLDLDVIAMSGEVNNELKHYLDESCGKKVPRERKINIYELTHLCKDFIIDKGYIPTVTTFSNKTVGILIKNINDRTKEEWFSSSNEPETVFKATKYIYNVIKRVSNEN